MNRQIGLIVFAVIFAGVYVYFFTDLFKPKRPIQIYAQIRPVFPSSRHNRNSDLPKQSDMPPITFTLDDDYRLTEVKVVETEDYKTNKYAHAVWHLITDTSSQPTKGIVYGMKVKGMKPSIPKGHAEVLEPETAYTLLIEAGKSKGEVHFKIPVKKG